MDEALKMKLMSIIFDAYKRGLFTDEELLTIIRRIEDKNNY